jgi:hypothetical protein
MAGMGVLTTIVQWASGTWNRITTAVGDVETVLQDLWSYITAVYSGLGWIVLALIDPGMAIVALALQSMLQVVQGLRNAIDRMPWWIDTYMIQPVRATLQIEIVILQLWTQVHLAELQNLVMVLHLVEERHTDTMVAQEAQQRAAAVTAARAYALALNNQLHQAIENEAVAGYKAGQGIRTTLIQQLAADLNVRGILDTVTTDLLVKAIGIVVTIDDPVLAATANRILSEIVKKTGLGDDIAGLIDTLITPGAGGAAPKDLTGVIADITHRLGVIEDWISQFMLDGGPELEDAGKQWKSINSLIVDGALLAFFGQAVAAPQAWATEVSDSIGEVANATVSGIISLINHV